MNNTLLKFGFVIAAGLLAAACGGNVVIDSGTGNGGAGGATITNACQHYADALIAKYAECGIEVGTSGSGGSYPCSASDAATSTCLEGCLPTIDCPCTVDSTGPGCGDKLKPFADCVTKCVN
jgi:hypothetical protein